MISHNSVLELQFPDLTCSQCGRGLGELGGVGGYFLGMPVCQFCNGVIKEAMQATEVFPKPLFDPPYRTHTADELSVFTPDEGAQIIKMAKGRARTWLSENKNYTEAASKFGTAAWSRTVYGVIASKCQGEDDAE